MDPFIRTALDRAAVVRDIYRRVANVQHPDTWHPFNVICPTCGKVGTTIVTQWDGERVYYECRPNLVTWATGCGSSGWVSPFGGTGKLRLERGVGGPVVAVRRDDRAVRQGPLDRRRLARPLRRHRARGVRARAAAQPRRTSSSTSAARRCRPRRAAAPRRTRSPRSSRPNSSASSSCARSRTTPSTSIPTGTDQIPRLFDEFDKFAAATAGREVKGELPPGHAATFRYSLLDPDADVAAEAAALPARRSRTSPCSSRSRASTSRHVSRPEKGSPLTERETERRSTSGVARPAAWLEAYAPERARVSASARHCPTRPRTSMPAQRAYPREPRRRDRERSGPASGDALAGRHLRDRRRQAGLPLRTAFDAMYRAFLGRTEWAPSRLAACQARSGVRHRPPPEASRRPRRVVRHERRTAAAPRRAGGHPRGGDPQGRGPGPRRPGARARRASGASSSARARRSRPSGTPRRSGSARRSRRARPGRPGGRRAASAASVTAGERITALDATLDEITGGRSTTCSCASRTRPIRTSPSGGEEANVTIRTWGDLLPHDQPVAGEVGADAAAGGATWSAPAALGARRGPRHPRQRPRRQDHRLRASPSTRARGRRSSAD